MNYGELMAGLRQGKIGHLYLLAGEEAYYIDKAREALLKTWQCPMEDVQVADGTSLSEIMTLVESVPFLTYGLNLRLFLRIRGKAAVRN